MEKIYTDKLVEDLEQDRVKYLAKIRDREKEVSQEISKRALAYISGIKGFEQIRNHIHRVKKDGTYFRIENGKYVQLRFLRQEILLRLNEDNGDGHEKTFLYRQKYPLSDFGLIFKTDNLNLIRFIYEDKITFSYHEYGGNDLYQRKGLPNVWIHPNPYKNLNDEERRILLNKDTRRISNPILSWDAIRHHKRDTNETSGGWGDDITTYEPDGKTRSIMCGLNIDFQEIRDFSKSLDDKLGLETEFTL